MAVIQTTDNGRFAVTSANASSVRASTLAPWVGYHIAIVSGTGAGQIRYAITSAGEDRLVVSRDWDIIPDNTSFLQVAWNQDDYDSSWGNNFKLVLKAAAEWDVGTDVTIGNGTDAIVGGMVSNSISLDDNWTIANNGYFAMGYLFGTPPDHASLGGWYFNSNDSNSALGYKFLIVNPGGSLMVDGVNLGTVYAHGILCRSSSFCSFYDASFANLMYDGSHLKGYTYGRNLKFQGTGVANDYVVVASGMETFDGPIVLSNSYGFQSSATSETIRIKGYQSINAQQDIEAHNNTTWEFVNPNWGTPNILWTQNDAESQVKEIFTIDAQIRDTDGVALASAAFIVVQGSVPVSATTPNLVIADVSGTVYSEILARQFVSTTQTDAYGNFQARAWKWGYSPFGAILTVDQALDVPVAMPADTELTSETEASALTYNDIVLHDYSSAGSDGPMTVVEYHHKGGTDFTTDTVVSGATSGAHGKIREDLESNTSGGVVVLFNRSGGDFVNDEGIYYNGTQIASANVSSFAEDYMFEMGCAGRPLWQVYDHAMARFATQSAVVDAPVQAVRQRHTHTIEAAGGTYFTHAVASVGIWMSDTGTGTINYMEGDSGIQYIPPTTFDFTLTGLVADSEVQILDAATKQPITGNESSGTSFNYSYVYPGSDQNIIVIVFHLNYLAVWIEGLSLSNGDQSIPIQQTTDRVYSNA